MQNDALCNRSSGKTGPPGLVTKIILVVKLTLIFLIVALCAAANEGRSQSITFSGKNVSVEKVISIVERQAKFVFIYDTEILKHAGKISVTATEMPLLDFLSLVFRDQPFAWTIQNQTIVLKRNPASHSIINQPEPTSDPVSSFPISGVVKDAGGNVLKGITVMVKGSKIGTVTNENGQFELNVEAGQILVFSSVEFEGKEMKIKTSDNLADIILQKRITDLQEVVVNKGYYTESSRLSTGSVGRVSSETISKQPVTNVMGALIGRVPGLEITQGGGMPGAGFKVRIRGENSIAAGNNPLYIVDGVPFASESMGHNYVGQHLPYVDGSTLSPFNTLNPADIESIEVLKDADATAIYGSRGANGVILITTRKGKSGKTQFDVSMNCAFSKVTRFVEMLNTEEYLAIRKKAYANDGVTSYPVDAPDLNNWDQSRYTDWQKELLGGTADTWNFQGGVSGGSDRTQFLLRGSYQHETTVFPGDFSYKRGSMLFNLNHRSADSRFKLNLSTNYATDDNNMITSDITRTALMLPPNAPELYQEDGTLNWADGTWENPLSYLAGSYDGKNRNLNANLVMSYQLLPDLLLKTNLGYSDFRLNEYMTNPSTKYNPVWQIGSEGSYVFANTGSRQNWIVEPQLSWKTKLGKGLLQALGGATFQQQSSSRLGQHGYGFPSNSLIYDLSTASYQWVFLSENSLYKYHAFFGRLNYSWQDKYLLNMTARRDGSSRFSPERQFANFGAIGAAWIFTDEPFMQKLLPFLSFGKLRTSYGITGNDQIGDYQYLNTYSGSGGNNYQGVVGLLPQRLYNPDFGWESNKKLEAAMELRMFNDRVAFTAAWYRNRSSSQLVGIPLSGVTGFTSIQSNLDATVQNTGWEFELQATVVQRKSFRWSTSINLTIPRNKLLAFPGLEASSYANTYVVGQPLTIVKRFNMTGIDPNTGVYQYEDVNHDGQLSSAHDRSVIRNLASHYFGGFTNNITVGRWQVELFIQLVDKTGYNYLFTTGQPGTYVMNVPKEAVKNVWESGKENATMQVLTAGANQEAVNAWNMLYRSNAAISDYYFARLKNIAVSYQVPDDWLKGISGRFYLQAQNLLTLTNQEGTDPEMEIMQNLPPLKTINLGFQLTF